LATDQHQIWAGLSAAAVRLAAADRTAQVDPAAAVMLSAAAVVLAVALETDRGQVLCLCQAL
jgi:hypothetical protein